MNSSPEFIPVMKSKLPQAEAIIPYLRIIDRNEKYCNFGPLELEFRQRLGGQIGAQADQITTFCNGTIALTAALKNFELPKDSLCLMPAWTFTATPAAAMLAGLMPYFVDVEEQSWALTPAIARQAIAKLEGKVSCVVAVSPFGDPVDARAWEQFRAETGIPVLIDAAGAWDSFCQIDSFCVSEIPVMISLHGTKPLGIGEGGMVVCANRDYIHRLKGMSVFGFTESRNSDRAALNGKLSEYGAAVGLAALDVYPQMRAHFASLRDRYIDIFESLGIRHRLSEKWVSLTCNVVAPGKVQLLADAFAAASVETRSWWEQGCHRHLAYQACPKGALDVTERLVQAAFGVPFFYGMKEEHFDRIEQVLAKTFNTHARERQAAHA